MVILLHPLILPPPTTSPSISPPSLLSASQDPFDIPPPVSESSFLPTQPSPLSIIIFLNLHLPIIIVTRFKIDGHQCSQIIPLGVISLNIAINSPTTLSKPATKDNRGGILFPVVHRDLLHGLLILTESLYVTAPGKLKRFKLCTKCPRNVRPERFLITTLHRILVLVMTLTPFSPVCLARSIAILMIAILEDFIPSAPVDDRLYAPISADEASNKLRSPSNSAPGSDKVQYRHLCSVDPKCNILSSIFNRCLSESDVPEEWKTSSTILIHKKGDSSDVSNFRPIALMSCIYKLFMSILANRLVTFSINNNLLSDVQKSARPTEGCYEHTFILQSLVLDAKRLGKDLFISWLDLKNAFGSVPHDVIKTTLSHLGIPEGIIKLIENVYTNATTVVNTPSGSTSPIPILAGVKQGCPLSPILFNLCVEIFLAFHHG